MAPNLKLKDRDTALLCAELACFGAPVTDALSVAAYAHEGQFRRETRLGVDYRDPYISHPARNALRVARWLETSGDAVSESFVTAAVVAALLHDTVEDAPEKVVDFLGGELSLDPRAGALASIESEFGATAAEAVRRVTNPELSEGLTRAQRQQRYHEHLVEQVLSYPAAYLAKASDLVDNAGSLKHSDTGSKRTNLANKYREPVLTMAQRSEVLCHLNGTRATVTERLFQVVGELDAILEGTAP